MTHPDQAERSGEDYGGLAPDKVAKIKDDLTRFAVDTTRGMTEQMDRGQFEAKLFGALQKRLQNEGLAMGNANTVARTMIDEYFETIDKGNREGGAQ